MKLSKITLVLAMVLVLTTGCKNKVSSVNETASQMTTTEQSQAEPTAVKDTETTQEATVTETPSSELLLYPAYEIIDGEKKYGYIDAGGNFVIEPLYSFVSDFSEGLAAVSDGEKYKVIDTKGNVVFTTDYYMPTYKNGSAVFSETVGDNYLSGYLDKTGKVMIEPKYTYAEPFRADGTAIVSTESGTYAVIDQTGKVLESYKLDSKYSNVYGSEDGYVIFSDPDTYKQGILTYKGELILAPEYGEITYLGNDLFAVKKENTDTFEYMTQPAAIFNNKGEQLTDYTLYDLSKFTNDYASATDDTYTYFIGKDGQVAANLPKAEGRGTLTLEGSLIKAEVDDDLIYMTKDGTVIWQNDRTQKLSSGITVNAVKFKPNKYAIVYYPKVTGLTDEALQTSINAQLYKIFADSRADLTIEDATSVEDSYTAEEMKDLLIINKTGYDYPFGAAHGMPINDYYFINVKTGDFYELKDLFKKDSDYVSKINDIVSNMIEDKKNDEDAMIFEDGFQGIAENQSFRLTKDSLVIYFYPYEIAAYAAGFPEFEIPFDKLSDIIDKDGAFWNAFQ